MIRSASADDAAARAQNIHSVIAACSAENPRAVAFHEQMGFERLAVLREVGFKFDKWIDLILMQKLL